MDFKLWIKIYQNEDTPIGDLAEDICRDPAFPISNNYEDHYDYLQSNGACKDALIAFKDAWKMYSKMA